LDAKISAHAKDIIQKYASALFRNATLEFYGVKTAKIKELINIELPVVEVTDSAADDFFLLEDDSLLHYEFVTSYNKDDLIRFAGYDLRLYARDKRNIRTVIIYTADVKEPPAGLNIGSLGYNPDYIMMKDYDGDKIYDDLNAKIKAGQDLTDVDMLNLLFLPIMRITVPMNELAVKSIELAQTIPDTVKKNACIAATFAFANRYLNKNEMSELKEVIKMTDLLTMILEEAFEERDIEMARKMLKEGLTKEIIRKITEVDEVTISRLQAELNNA